MDEPKLDYVSEYLSALDKAFPNGMRSDASIVRDEALSDPEGSASGFSYNYENRMNELAALGRSGDYGAFTNLYNKLENAVTNNVKAIGMVQSIDAADASRDGVAGQARKGAGLAMSYAHRGVKFKLEDGTDVTAAEYASHSERYATPKTYGFTKADMDLYNGKATLPDGSPDLAAHDVLEPLVGKVVKSHRADVPLADVASNGGRPSALRNVIQLTDAGHYAAQNINQFRAQFGDDGSNLLFTWASDTMGDSGGIQDLIAAALRQAEKTPSAPDATSADKYERARSFVRGFDSIMSQAFRRPGRDAAYTPSERRWMVSAVADCVNADADFRLDSDGTKLALVRAADLFAHYESMGVSLATAAGRENVRDALTRYITYYDRFGREPSDNFITRARTLHSTLASRIVGSAASRPVFSSPTGDVSAHRNNMARSAGAESASPSADRLAEAFYSSLETAILPFMAKDGMNEATAARAMLADPEAKRRFLATVDSALMAAGAFRRAESASALRNAMVASLSAPGHVFDVTDWIRRKGFSPETNEKEWSDGPDGKRLYKRDYAAVLADYRAWYAASSPEGVLAESTPALVSHYMSDMGGRTQVQAVARAAEIQRRALDMIRRDKPLSEIKNMVDTELSVGNYLLPDRDAVYDHTGQLLTPDSDDARMKKLWERAFVQKRKGSGDDKRPADERGRLLDAYGLPLLRPGYYRSYRRVHGDYRNSFRGLDRESFARLQRDYALDERTLVGLRANYARKLNAQAAKDPYLSEMSAPPRY